MRSLYFLFAVCLGVLASGCSNSAETAKNNPGPNSNSSSSNQVQTANFNAGSSNSLETPNSNASVVNTEPFANMRDRRVNRKVHDANPSATPLPLQFQAAGEDSEWAATMNPDGTVLEVRVFKSHPQLAKVEVMWQNAKEKVVKFYLRNGKILEVKTDRIANLEKATTQQLLDIAGIH